MCRGFFSHRTGWIGISLLLLLLAWPAAAAEIHGLVFISETGELDDGFVLRGENLEVQLLKAEVEPEWRRLRRDGWAKVRAQEGKSQEARRAWERTPPSGEKNRRAEIMKKEQKAHAQMVEDHTRRVDELLRQNTLQRVRTNAEGLFRFTGLPAGRYLLQARFQILGMGMFHDWLVPVEVKETDRIEIRLSRKNTTLLYAE
jgi:hypothetical protein